MAGIKISYILVLVLCPAFCLTQNTCDSFEMKKEISKTNSFERKFRKVFRSSDLGKIECSQLCFRDDRCNGILVCAGVCHLFGVFNISQSTVSGTNNLTCEVFNMNRCRNKGFPDDDGYCRCPRGYGGPFCEIMVQDSCYNEWKLIHDSTDPQTFLVFRLAAEDLCEKRLKYITANKTIHMMNSYGVTNVNTWTQSLYHLNKSSWNSFDDKPKRLFEFIGNAKYQTIYAFDIDGSPALSSKAEITTNWYMKDFSDLVPQFANDPYGMVVAGDFHTLLSKIQAGSAMPYLQHVFINLEQNEIAVSDLSHQGGTTSATYTAMNSPAYWFLYRASTLGTLSVLQWKTGLGSLFSAAQYRIPYNWCTDDCWVRIFTTDEFGLGNHGSLTGMARALLSGHQLRVLLGAVASPTRVVYIHGQTITVCLGDMMEPIGVTNLNSSGTAQMKIVSSNGQVQTRRYTLETNNIIEDVHSQQEIQWFVDTREWNQMLSMTGAGLKISGSVADLRKKVQMGASVRIVVEYSNGLIEIVDVDHLEVSSQSQVAAEIIYHANVQFGENYNVTFANATSYHLWSAIITTEGDLKKYFYTYKKTGGQHETLSSDVDRYTWFVQV